MLQPPKGRVAAKTEAFRRELDLRTAALDRGESVDPAKVRREIQTRHKNFKELQAKMSPASRARSKAKADAATKTPSR
jgi:hypothetical protein